MKLADITFNSDLLSNIADMSGALLSVAVTIVVFVPAFIEIARSKSPDYLSGEQQKRTIRSAFLLLNVVVVFFAVALVAGVIGMIFPKLWLMLCSTLFLLLGVLFLIISTIRLSYIVLKSLF